MVARHLVTAGEVVPVNTPIAVIAAQGESVDFEALLGKQAAGETKTAEEKGAVSVVPAPTVVAGVSAPEIVPVPAPEAMAPEATGLPGGVRASPLARRMAEQLRIDLKAVRGTGPDGRISKRDVEAFLAAPARQAAAVSPPGSAAAPGILQAPLPATPPPPSTTIAVPKLRALIGKRMVEAKQQVPHFYVTHEYDVQALLALRQEVNTLLPEEEKISVNDFIVKAVALTLRQFPNLNASLQGNEIVHHGAVNIGVAVAVEGGLLTVVCHDTDRKPLRQIAVELKSKAGRAREGKVRPEDIEGSTFSVSNMGMFDVEHFIAIINPPEAAILAIGSARQVPVVKDGQVVPGNRLKATISVDHRVSDGAEAARFLQALAASIEQPLRLLI
jgi:pyruvate dehydrogenase E2 component (dihydrolipoamide acetyltransferase)